jgi:predicted TIM-barrel fold metal-dependent hydrolase
MIIDIHSHLGDILYPQGGQLISKMGIGFPSSSVINRLYEKALYRETFATRLINYLFPMMTVNCERRRNFAATLENLQASIQGSEISLCVCSPVAPNNTFEDILAAGKADSRIIAFTSPDYSAVNTSELLMRDLKNGAAGVKIHPIIQEVQVDSEKVIESLEVISAFSKPVLLHSGRALYYETRENKSHHADNAFIDKILRLVSMFPAVKFIIGHGGLNEIRQVIDLLPKYKNTYVDTSFQPPEAIRALISAFGGSRVMYASDWPYGLRQPAILAVKEACGNDTGLLNAVFYDNAAELLGNIV